MDGMGRPIFGSTGDLRSLLLHSKAPIQSQSPNDSFTTPPAARQPSRMSFTQALATVGMVSSAGFLSYTIASKLSETADRKHEAAPQHEAARVSPSSLLPPSFRAPASFEDSYLRAASSGH